MSYTIKIGNAIPVAEEGWLEVHVPQIIAPDAPRAAGDFAADVGSNVRSPSYAGWAQFTERTLLRKLFYGPRGLLKRHPGVIALTVDHLQVIRIALDRYVTKHPNAKPGWCLCAQCDEDVCGPSNLDAKHDPDLDPDLARLQWLAFWMERTRHSPCPAMENY